MEQIEISNVSRRLSDADVSDSLHDVPYTIHVKKFSELMLLQILLTVNEMILYHIANKIINAITIRPLGYWSHGRSVKVSKTEMDRLNLELWK